MSNKFLQDQDFQSENSEYDSDDGIDVPQQNGINYHQEQSNQEQRPENLREWIRDLNDEYHSEDEGIEDYKIGGYHPCHIGEVLINRYVLIQKLGWGHFSTVWLAKDFKFGTYVAVKVMKSAPHYLDASYDEVEILQKIAKLASNKQWIQSVSRYKNKRPSEVNRDDSHVLNLLNCFLYKGPYGNHFCMVYEILGVNLLEVLKRTDYKGLSLDTVRQLTRQILMGLDFLNRICKIIHTDLKPENVLVCLTEDQIKKIVDDGQLSNKDVFMERLRYYRKYFGFGDKLHQEEQSDEYEQIVQLTKNEERIKSLEKKLQNTTMTKNAKKSIKKKIRKLVQKEKKRQESNNTKKVVRKKKQIRKDILSKAINPKLVFDKVKPLEDGFQIKVADLGNACWTHYHFATEIQTRQYRGPEVILGSKYNTTADLWSLACMTFQMLTGDLLFNPKRDKNDIYGKNDDHIAQMMELLGIFPKSFSRRCSKFKKYFSTNGKLKRVPNLQQWSIKDFMIAKYGYLQDEAEKFELFMRPMLNCLPQKRATAKQMLEHPWLDLTTKEQKMPQEEHERIKKQRYQLDQTRDELWQYTSDLEDGSQSSNNEAKDGEDSDTEWYELEKKNKYIANVRLVDHSFTDIGYTGYSEGINLQKLDSIANWQFT